MNERIRELAEQATTVEHGVIQPRTVATVYHFDKQKFAELIVKECVKVAMRSVGDDEPKEAWYLIQEHFGVDK